MLDPWALSALMVQTRTFLLPCWHDVHTRIDHPDHALPSWGMCRLTSVFLLALLARYDPKRHWTLAGGAPLHQADPYDLIRPHMRPGGYHAQDGWQGHYWVESTGMLVDLTADQFGGDPVYVGAIPSHGYRRNYTRRALNRIVEDCQWRSVSWLEAFDSRPHIPSFLHGEPHA